MRASERERARKESGWEVIYRGLCAREREGAREGEKEKD